MPDINEFIQSRLDDQIAYFNSAASREQGHAKDWQFYMIVSAAATPMLIGIAELLPDFWSSFVRGAALISSAVAAVAASILARRQYEENGITYRAQEQTLIREKSLFLMKAGEYAGDMDDDAREKLLVENVEAIIAADVVNWTGRMREASKQAISRQTGSTDKKDAAG